MTTTKEKAKPFELIVGDTNGEIQSGDIPVRWCLTPEFVTELEEQGIVDPHILLVTAYHDIASVREMQRKLIPVGELMTYARFTRSGKMSLHAWIVDGALGRREIHHKLSQKICGAYGTTVFDVYGKPKSADELTIFMAEARCELKFAKYVGVDVLIPNGVFGKEPHPLVKKYVNMWHDGRIVDECHFRRRMILAFTLKWIPVLLWTVLLASSRVLAAGFLTVAGWRKACDWKHIFHVYSPRYLIEDVANITETGWKNNEYLWWRTAKSKDWMGEDTTYDVVHFTPVIANPLLVGVIWFTCFIISAETAMNGGPFAVASYWTLEVMFAVAFFTVALDVSIEFAAWSMHSPVGDPVGSAWRWVVERTWGRFDTFVTERNRWPEVIGVSIGIVAILAIIGIAIFWKVVLITLITVLIVGALVLAMFFLYQFLFNHTVLDIEHNDITEIRELLCPADPENLDAKLKAIPMKRRTLRLWYLDMKNKVCKPMQY